MRPFRANLTLRHYHVKFSWSMVRPCLLHPKLPVPRGNDLDAPRSVQSFRPSHLNYHGVLIRKTRRITEANRIWPQIHVRTGKSILKHQFKVNSSSTQKNFNQKQTPMRTLTRLHKNKIKTTNELNNLALINSYSSGLMLATKISNLLAHGGGDPSWLWLANQRLAERSNTEGSYG